MELYELTALELAGQLQAGAVTQAEAIAAAAGRIAACQPGNNAFITVADSPAPAPARPDPPPPAPPPPPPSPTHPRTYPPLGLRRARRHDL